MPIFLLDDGTDCASRTTSHSKGDRGIPTGVDVSKVSPLSMFLILDFKYICFYFVNEIANCSYFIKSFK